MDQTWLTMITAVIALFGVIAIGAAARTVNWLTEEADQTLLKLVIRVLVPALIFRFIVGNEALDQANNIIYPPLLGFAGVAAGFGIATFAAHLFASPLQLHTPPQRRAFGLSAGIQNYGYLPIPLAYALFGEDTVGVLLVHNLGVELAFWTLGIFTVTGGLGRGWYLRLVNPPLVAIVIALLLNAAGPFTMVPAFLRGAIATGVDMLADCAIPVALLLIGATIADFVRQARLVRGLRSMIGSVVLRLGLMPVLLLALAWQIPGISDQLKQVMVLQAAMPAAIFPIVIARHYGGDVPTAVRVVLSTSLVSLVTMPMWLSFGLKLLGVAGGDL